MAGARPGRTPSRRKRLSVRARQRLFDEFDRWGFDQRGWSGTTRRKYYNRARAADQWLSTNRRVSLIWATPKDLQAFLFSTSPTARNRNNVRQALVGFGAFLVAQGFAEVNPALALPRLPEPSPLPKALDHRQAVRVRGAARLMGGMKEALVLVMLYGALRKSEARLLERRHLDERCGWLRFPGKGGRVRDVPLNENAQAALRRWESENPDPRWVFPSPRNHGSPVSDTYIRELVYLAGDMAGVEGLHPHVLRHTAATAMLEAGADIRTVQEFLGHADIKNTTIYTRIRPARVRDATDRLDFEE